LLTQTQTYVEGQSEQLQVRRSKEQEIYDFIYQELEAVVEILPPSYTASQGQFRASKWAALALQSRAMLYAASSAQYATVQLDGLLGIPAQVGDLYWQRSFDASQRIIQEGGFALYDVNPDKALNFQELFLKGDELTNKETIFVRSYVYPGVSHNFDYYNQPNSFWKDYGSATNPTVELVEAFEYIDGSPGQLKVKDSQGQEIAYAHPQDIFANKDPRLFGSIITPNSLWAYNGRTSVVELRRGIMAGGVKIERGTINPTEVYGTAPNQISIVGDAGPLFNSGDATKTGFYIKKFLTNDAAQVGGANRSVVPYMVFRYGEILLNHAEAALALDLPADALKALNLIRDRAGIVARSTVDMDAIRKERRVELAFENHRFWDLRRWRIAADEINNKQSYALFPYLLWEEGKNPADMKYIFEIVPTSKNPRTFPARLYYEPIPNSGMPYLVQNPEY